MWTPGAPREQRRQARDEQYAPAQGQRSEQGDRRHRRRGRGRRRRPPVHRHRPGGECRRRVHQDQRLVDGVHRAVRHHERHRADEGRLDAPVRPALRYQAQLAVERRVERERAARHREAADLGQERAGGGQVGDRRLRRQRQREPDGLPHRRRQVFRRRRRHARAERPPDPVRDTDADADTDAHCDRLAEHEADSHPVGLRDPRQRHHHQRRLRPLRRHLPLPRLRPAGRRRRHRREGLQPRVHHGRRRLHAQVGRCDGPGQ